MRACMCVCVCMCVYVCVCVWVCGCVGVGVMCVLMDMLVCSVGMCVCVGGG